MVTTAAAPTLTMDRVRSIETKNKPGNDRKPLSTAVLPMKFFAVASMRTAMRNSFPVFIVPDP